MEFLHAGVLTALLPSACSLHWGSKREKRIGNSRERGTHVSALTATSQQEWAKDSAITPCRQKAYAQPWLTWAQVESLCGHCWPVSDAQALPAVSVTECCLGPQLGACHAPPTTPHGNSRPCRLVSGVCCMLSVPLSLSKRLPSFKYRLGSWRLAQCLLLILLSPHNLLNPFFQSKPHSLR